MLEVEGVEVEVAAAPPPLPLPPAAPGPSARRLRSSRGLGVVRVAGEGPVPAGVPGCDCAPAKTAGALAPSLLPTLRVFGTPVLGEVGVESLRVRKAR